MLKRNLFIALFIVLLIALAIIIYVVPGVTGMLVETYTAEYGNLSIHDDTVGYFFRDDTVYGADSSGDVNRLAEEGDLLRAYTVVVEVSGGSAQGETDGNESGGDRLTEIKNSLGSTIKTGTSYTLETGGIVSFYVDGYENTFNLSAAGSASRDRLSDVKQSQVVDTGLIIRSGYPIFKIVSNTGWEIVAYVPIEHQDSYVEGRTCDVTFYEPDENRTEFSDLSDKEPIYNTVEMIIDSVTQEGDYAKLILRSSRYFGGVGQYRVADCRIVSSDVNGLLIENESITEKNGKVGVYVKNKKGKYDFIPVLIYGKNDTTTVIADTYYYDEEGEYIRTVDPFDDVLRNPENAGEDNEE